jgi:hypothetical protein
MPIQPQMPQQPSGFGHSNQMEDLGQPKQSWTTPLECENEKCSAIDSEPFLLYGDPKSGKGIAICPKCGNKTDVILTLKNKEPEKNQDGQFVVTKTPVVNKTNALAQQERNIMSTKTAQKRDLDGLPEKGTFKGPRVWKMHEDVNPQGKTTIGPFTEEREEYKDEHKVFQATSETKNMEIKEANSLSIEEEKELLSSDKILTQNAKVELAKTASMYQQVQMFPASMSGNCQWCPKLRNAVSMDVCATKCIDGRREPQTKGFETYRDYLVQGGDPNGKIICGYKEWLKREVDAFYPGWVEDHIRKAGGEVVGSETNFGNRRMNLDEGERRHLPRYPEEKLIEKQLEERHQFVPEFKTASAKNKNND